MAYERTWQFQFGLSYAPITALDQTRYQQWALKAMLCGQLGGFVSGLWQVYGSCDSVTAGNSDGPGNGGSTDRWLSAYDGTKLVNAAAASPHSWVTLKSPSMNGVVFYMLIAFDSATATATTVLLAKTPFAGGTTTANPTSADSWIVGSTASSAINSGTTPPTFIRTHMCLSTLGDFFYFTPQAGQGGASFGVAIIAPIGCSPLDPYPVWTHRGFSNTSPWGFPAASLSGSTAANAARLASGAAASYSIGSFAVTVNDQSLPDILTSKLFTLPCWVNVYTGTTWHARGRLPDCFGHVGTAAVPPQGTVVRDNTGAIAYVLVGSIYIPANDVPATR